jgi:hypothetical protein
VFASDCQADLIEEFVFFLHGNDVLGGRGHNMGDHGHRKDVIKRRKPKRDLCENCACISEAEYPLQAYWRKRYNCGEWVERCGSGSVGAGRFGRIEGENQSASCELTINQVSY